jgi:hypothetical protein
MGGIEWDEIEIQTLLDFFSAIAIYFEGIFLMIN